jgi:hypothetical protein
MSYIAIGERACLVREVAERLCSRGQTEREWFEGWQAEFDAVTADADDEARAVLVDMLIAFDHWQRDKRHHVPCHPLPSRGTSRGDGHEGGAS